MRTFSLSIGTLAVALAWAGAACIDPASPEAALIEGGLVLSEVIETTDARTVYVSLRGGTVPGGVTAKATNVRTGTSLEAAMVDGGLDPIAMPASESDSIEVQTRDQAGGLRRFGGTVSLKYPPVIVRTGPMRGATDVGLNSLIIVVFSEPIDEQTLSPETIELTLDGDRVPVEVKPSSDGLRAEVNPGGLLPSREYVLVIRRGVRDRDGLNLKEEYRTTFHTLNAPAVASISLTADSLNVEVGQPMALHVRVQDAAGKALTDRRVTWIVAPSAAVGPGDTARMMAPGEARVTAQSEGVSASVTLRAAHLHFRQVALGDNHTCAVTTVGFAYCWGANSWGQLGVGDTLGRSVPTAVRGGLSLRSVTGGAAVTCARNSEDASYCWGARESYRLNGNVYYEIGDTAATWPIRVHQALRFQELSLGWEQGCGVAHSGATLCWGEFPIDPPIGPSPWPGTSDYGIDPDFATEFLTEPRLRSLDSGDKHSCGIAPDGKAICWGVNILGQLGDGTLSSTQVWTETDTAFEFDPHTTTVDTDIPFDVITSGSNHTCALDGGGRAYCWGDNREGQLGTGPASECLWSDIRGPYDCRMRPAPVLGGVAFKSISAGSGFTCGVALQGAAYCWGRNSRGQLGNGSRAAASAPMPVTGGPVFAEISAGGDHACGLTEDELLYCWGRGAEGQLGNVQTADALLPVRVDMQVQPASLAQGVVTR